MDTTVDIRPIDALPEISAEKIALFDLYSSIRGTKRLETHWMRHSENYMLRALFTHVYINISEVLWLIFGHVFELQRI